VTTTLALGANGCAELGEFVELFPEVKLQLLLSDDELDLSMRRGRRSLAIAEPISRPISFAASVHRAFPRYASADYLKKSGSRARSRISINTALSPSRADGDAFPL